MLGVDENDELIDSRAEAERRLRRRSRTSPQMILENLKTAGVQQAHKEDRITFTVADAVARRSGLRRRPLPGRRHARSAPASSSAPSSAPSQRADLVAAAREAGDAGFDVLIACAFNYDAHATEFNKLGRIPVLKARMNADLHMADDLKNTGKGNLFVIFGEPDIDISMPRRTARSGQGQRRRCLQPQTGEVGSDGADGIACWFIDTDYNEESFFVRHAYFLGANDPYKCAQDHAQGRDRRGSLGDAEQRHLAPVREAEVRAHRREGDQPPGRRGDEGVQGVRPQLIASLSSYTCDHL